MFKIIRNNCCGLDVHKTWIYACIGITDAHSRTEYFEARFSSFPKDLRKLSAWLQEHHCEEVCMESSGKYWIPVFNALETTCKVTLAHPKYTKPLKGNKTDRKDARCLCELFMCGMTKPSFIPPPAIRHLRDLIRYRLMRSKYTSSLFCHSVNGLFFYALLSGGLLLKCFKLSLQLFKIYICTADFYTANSRRSARLSISNSSVLSASLCAS